VEKAPLSNYAALANRLKSANIKAAIEIRQTSAATSSADALPG